MTTLAILCALLLYVVCGTGPTLLLLPRRVGPERLVAIPVIGLCSGVLVTLFLARFGLVGRTIGLVSFVLFCIAAFAALIKERPSRKEFAAAFPILTPCLACAALIAWPLVRAGYENYWGYANPDHALYISIIQYLDGHPFGVPSREFLGTFHVLGSEDVFSVGYDSSVILGISYFFSMLSALTRIPVALLFGVVTASVASLVPASMFLLCSLGLDLSRRVSIAITALCATSSLVAYAFYLHSLGTMTVIAVLPAGVAFAVGYFNRPDWRTLVVLTIIAAGMYYTYFPGFAFLGVSIAAMALCGMLRRKYTIRSVAILGVAILGALALIWHTHGLIILRRLLFESLSNRLTARDELLATFDLTLTERGLPFFWGLALPFAAPPAFLGGPHLALVVLLALSVCMFVMLGVSAWTRFTSVPPEFTSAILVLLVMYAVYAITGLGYGAFKLIAWVHVLMLAALGAASFGIVTALKRTRFRFLSVCPVLLMTGYAGLNALQAVQLGRNSLTANSGQGSVSNAPRLQLESFRDLQSVSDRYGKDGITITLPDSVTQRWVVPFFSSATSEFFPRVDLNVVDSSPRTDRPQPKGKYVLHWIDDSQEVFGSRADRAVWRNQIFALTPLADCQDMLVFGIGWYRAESASAKQWDPFRRFRWLRKRGELLVLNPSGKPKRLLLKLAAGHGIPNPDRHVDLFLNGTKFDEIRFSGLTRTLSRPFLAAQPWSQIELAVHETAAPLPRELALWNRWVPGDARQLNIALAEAELVPAEHVDEGLPTAVDFTSPAQATKALVDGVYADGWVGSEATIMLHMPARAENIEVKGLVPGVKGLSFPYRITLYLDGKRLGGEHLVQQAGDFRASFPIDDNNGMPTGSGRSATVTIRPSGTFNGYSLGISPDRRSLSILLRRVAISSRAQQLAGAN